MRFKPDKLNRAHDPGPYTQKNNGHPSELLPHKTLINGQKFQPAEHVVIKCPHTCRPGSSSVSWEDHQLIIIHIDTNIKVTILSGVLIHIFISSSLWFVSLINCHNMVRATKKYRRKQSICIWCDNKNKTTVHF